MEVRARSCFGIVRKGAQESEWGYLPAVNLINDPCSTSNPMSVLEILAHPFNKVVLEDTLNQLMQQIWGDQFVYICPWKVRGVWLTNLSVGMFM